MKKAIAGILSLVMLAGLAACGGQSSSVAEQEPAAEQTGAPAAEETNDTADAAGGGDDRPIAGMVWHDFSDTFITAIRNAVDEEAANGSIAVVAADSRFDIPTQTNNINNLLAQDVDFLTVCNINVNEAGTIINQAKEKDIPIIFVNCTSPTEEELAMYDKAFHVSSAAEQSGWIQGEMAVEYWNAHPEADRNGNGKMDYVMLQGNQGVYDTIVRTTESIAKVNELGVETNCIQEAVCDWSRAEAMYQMASIIAARGDEIDVVFANNDDMALGAIEALKAAGYFTDESNYIPVLGVDATAVGIEALEEGTLLGTSFNNPVASAQTVYKIMELLLAGEEITSETVGMPVDGQHVWLDYVAISADNVDLVK